jgi:hypothetical protein
MVYLMGKIPSNYAKDGTSFAFYTATASASQNGAVDKGDISHAKQDSKRHAYKPNS